MTPLAPSSAAFFRIELYIPSSLVQPDSPLAFRIATSVYAFPTLSGLVKSDTPFGQTGESFTVGFMSAALVLTHAPRRRGAATIRVDQRIGRLISAPSG